MVAILALIGWLFNLFMVGLFVTCIVKFRASPSLTTGFLLVLTAPYMLLLLGHL